MCVLARGGFCTILALVWMVRGSLCELHIK
ncbi:Hok/Gef family protein [Salmonella enterica subsp. enterica serovar Poona]|nr:Hok/Gef family protein [Salmonella enterica]EKO0906863.1 Hok/Gef family protein [Salmonella enterica subsp. enterica]